MGPNYFYDFKDSIMANPEHLAILKQGVEVWNKWREDNEGIIPDLREANLIEADLTDADLRYVDLRGACLIAADITCADLSNAKLKKADVSEATFDNTSLIGADLRDSLLLGANLSKMSLDHANLSGAKLIGANLRYTQLGNAKLKYADLTNTSLVGTKLNCANIEGAKVYGISAWNIKKKGLIQKDLVITRAGEPKITVDDLEMAQFIYLMLNNEKIRDVIDTLTSKAVLILGRFSDERKPLLDPIR